MRTNLVFPVFAIVCALTMWSCSGGSMPSSPSMLSPLSAPGGAGGRLRTLDDPPAPAMPDPAAPTPMAVIINIVGAFGANAFMPNPTTANMGDQIVFTNTDTRLHHIMLDDGTDLGDVEPGASSAPIPLMTPTASFHCAIHPTMIGGINMEVAAPYEPPPDDYYGYY
jgi:plastocyanin